MLILSLLDLSGVYLNISSAVNAANDGDTIIIANGTYTGEANKNIVINKNITIQGAGIDKTIIDLQGSGRAFTINTTKILIIKEFNYHKRIYRYR